MGRASGTYSGKKFVIIVLSALVAFGVLGIIGTYYLAQSAQPFFLRRNKDVRNPKDLEAKEKEEALRRAVESRQRSHSGG